MELDLQELRNEIDQINKTLVTALEARLEAVLKVAASGHHSQFAEKPPVRSGPEGCHGTDHGGQPGFRD